MPRSNGMICVRPTCMPARLTNAMPARYKALSGGRSSCMTDKATSDLWWKNAVIYCADVATWVDSDGDGVGDLAGLTRRLDYLAGLGITTLWMMPFYPSPLGDDGYDITDYYAVDSRFGTLGDFVEMIRTADNLGIRALVDLVLSHTSNQHPWFQQARRDRSSRRSTRLNSSHVEISYAVFCLKKKTKK